MKSHSLAGFSSRRFDDGDAIVRLSSAMSFEILAEHYRLVLSNFAEEKNVIKLARSFLEVCDREAEKNSQKDENVAGSNDVAYTRRRDEDYKKIRTEREERRKIGRKMVKEKVKER